MKIEAQLTQTHGTYQWYFLILLLTVGASTWASIIDPDEKAITASTRPLLFEQNNGQFDSKVKFLAKGRGYNIALGRHPVVELYRFKFERPPLSMIDPDLPAQNLMVEDHAIFRIRILGSNPNALISPVDEAITKTHYLIGEKANWKTGISNFRAVRYADVLENIDVLYYGNNGRLEYDFVIRPSAEVADIQISFDGIEDLRLNAAGELVLSLGEQEIVQRRPVAYQLDDAGNKHNIPARYALTADNVSFVVGNYDRNKTLIIDPVLEYSTYYGGSGNDLPRALDVDAADNLYLIGTTTSPSLATAGAFQETNLSPTRSEFISFPFCSDCTDALPGGSQVERVTIIGHFDRSVFVSKFSPDGAQLLWSTYFSAPNGDGLTLGINSAAVSPTGEVAFGLTTNAPAGLPLVNSTQSFSTTQRNVYVAKLNAAGDALVFSTYLHIGPDGFWLRGLDVGADGSVAAVGVAGDSSVFTFGVADIDFPEINPLPGQNCALDVSNFDFYDGWVIRFDPSGMATFASCLGGAIWSGGSIAEGLRGVAIGSNGHLYVLGYSAMTDFPVVNPIQANLSSPGVRDATVTQIDPATSQIVFSSYLGPVRVGTAPAATGFPSADNFPIDIAVDLAGNIFVTGKTNHTGWPAVNAFQPNLSYPEVLLPDTPFNRLFKISQDIYLTKIDPVSTSIIFSTYLGGSKGEHGLHALTLDAAGNSYILSLTDSDDYPVSNPLQASKTGRTSPVVSKFSPQGALVFSSYLGGTDDRIVQVPGGIVVNSAGKLIIAAQTEADDFNVVVSGTSRAGGFDATLMIIDQSGDPDTDGDGVIDSLDAFPADATEWRDTDGDLTGDNADDDDDGDGALDVDDIFPLDPTETLDSDSDGVGDVADLFPMDPLEVFDNDGNGLGDFTETDADKDGIANNLDFRPFDASETLDTDRDGIGNNTDTDDDGDGIADASDPAPTNPDDPVITFNLFNAANTSLYKSPLPQGFSQQMGSDRAWTSASDQSFSGNVSLGSLSISDNQTSGVQYVETFETGTLSFQYRVDSELDFDLLTFSMDGNLLLTKSGQIDWTLFAIPVAAGPHILLWQYSKNGSIAVGADAAWIDDIAGAPAAPVDLVVTLSNTTGVLNGGESVNFVTVVSNASPASTVTARFQFPLPPEFSNATWTCAAAANSTCTSNVPVKNGQRSSAIKGTSGTGEIDALIDVAAGSSVTFSWTADVQAFPEVTTSISATVTPAEGIREDVTNNNTVTGQFQIGLFGSGFED